MLKILLENATLTCQKSGQAIDVALVKGEWLHEGNIVCPPCNQFCDDCSNSAAPLPPAPSAALALKRHYPQRASPSCQRRSR